MALILRAAIELVLTSEFTVMFSGPPSFGSSADLGGEAVFACGLSRFPLIEVGWEGFTCWPGDPDVIDEVDEEDKDGAVDVEC